MARDIIQRYDDAVSDPVTRKRMHRVTHYLASTDRECLGQDLRAFVDGQNLSAKLRTEITAEPMMEGKMEPTWFNLYGIRPKE